MNHTFIKTTLLFAIVLFTNALFSQTIPESKQETKPEDKIDFAMEGMIGLSFGNNIVGINVGGPSLKVKLQKCKIGVGAFPSLIILDKKAMPRLAVSPIIEYKKWMLITPYYGYDAKDKMIWTFGLGYKFK